MAIVGPRPLLVRYLERYNEEQHHRHDVRPGLTGYAQAHGRNAISWEDKFAMDVWYTKHITFLGDIKILIDTVMVVFKRSLYEELLSIFWVLPIHFYCMRINVDI